MEIKTHEVNTIKIAEATADYIFINNAQDGLDLLGNLYYQGFDNIIIHQKNLALVVGFTYEPQRKEERLARNNKTVQH